MKANTEFRKDLIIPYLGLLIENGQQEEFDKYFPEVRDYLASYVNDKVDLERLNTVKSILSYGERTNNVTMQR